MIFNCDFRAALKKGNFKPSFKNVKRTKSTI